MEFLKELAEIHRYLPHFFIASFVIAIIFVGQIIISLFSSIVDMVKAWQAPKMPVVPPGPPPTPKTRLDILHALIAERNDFSHQIGTRPTHVWEDQRLRTLNAEIEAMLQEGKKWLSPVRACLGRVLFYKNYWYQCREEDKKIPRNWVISGKGSSCAFPHHSSMDKNIYCWTGHEIHASYTTWRTSTNLEARSWLRFGNGSIFTRLRLYHPIIQHHFYTNRSFTPIKVVLETSDIKRWYRDRRGKPSSYLCIFIWNAVRAR